MPRFPFLRISFSEDLWTRLKNRFCAFLETRISEYNLSSILEQLTTGSRVPENEKPGTHSRLRGLEFLETGIHSEFRVPFLGTQNWYPYTCLLVYNKDGRTGTDEELLNWLEARIVIAARLKQIFLFSQRKYWKRNTYSLYYACVHWIRQRLINMSRAFSIPVHESSVLKEWERIQNCVFHRFLDMFTCSYISTNILG